MAAELEPYVNHTVSIITADGRNIVINDLTELYEQWAKTEQPVEAILQRKGDNKYILETYWRCRNLGEFEFNTFVKEFDIRTLNETVDNASQCGRRKPINDESIPTISRSGHKVFSVKTKNSKEETSSNQLIRVDTPSGLKTFNVDKIESHGKVLLENQFGFISWSPSEELVMYVAEYKESKATSYFETLKDSDKSKLRQGKQFLYEADWGESLSGVKHTVICIMNPSLKCNESVIRVVEMKGYSVGQPFWIGKDDNKIGFLAWIEQPHRLGLTYCYIRESQIYTLDLSDPCSLPIRLLGTQDTSIRWPRLSRNSNKLLYLENDVGGPHYQSSRLNLYNFENNETVVVIPTNMPHSNVGDEKQENFRELFALDILPHNCWSDDEEHILICSVTETKSCLYSVELKTKKVTKIPCPYGSVSLLDLKSDIMVIAASSVNMKPDILVGKFDPKNLDKVVWHKMNNSDSVSDIQYKVDYIDCSPNESNAKISTILIGPKGTESRPTPTIILPHGGPHSSFQTGYMTYPILFSKLGFKTLLVNYRGSLGADTNYVQSLCGKVGKMDVEDVMTAIRFHIANEEVDSNNLILFGGSHGGFLVTHLSGQHPEMNFKACICRNPVVDVYGMMEQTDIPDWCWTETIGLSVPYSTSVIPTLENIEAMVKMSPMYHVERVKVPTLMMLGKKDRRVPMSQGLKYYNALKSRGIKCLCYVYDDKHDLYKVDVDSDAFINLSLWIFNNMDVAIPKQ